MAFICKLGWYLLGGLLAYAMNCVVVGVDWYRFKRDGGEIWEKLFASRLVDVKVYESPFVTMIWLLLWPYGIFRVRYLIRKAMTDAMRDMLKDSEKGAGA